jgi:hypothetical protein
MLSSLSSPAGTTGKSFFHSPVSGPKKAYPDDRDSLPRLLADFSAESLDADGKVTTKVLPRMSAVREQKTQPATPQLLEIRIELRFKSVEIRLELRLRQAPKKACWHVAGHWRGRLQPLTAPEIFGRSLETLPFTFGRNGEPPSE